MKSSLRLCSLRLITLFVAGGGGGLVSIAMAAGAPAFRTVDLKPFLGRSQFQTIGAEWVLPRGRQRVEGVPFQVDGVVEVAGSSSRFSNVGRTNVNDIPIGASFERLHLLAAASRDVKEGELVARLQLHYADGTKAEVRIEYGRQLADWMGARHKGETPLIDPDARVAWQVEHAAAARRDDSLRLYYAPLANPDPGREVRSLSVISARARGGLMIAALTVGPERVDPADRLPDTLVRAEEHFHIEGAAKPALTGRVYDEKGAAMTNAVARIISVKTVDSSDALTPADSEFVGREARTDAGGRWRLADLSERLLYRLLIATPETQASMYDGADPLAGSADVQLRAGAPGETGQYLVHARLVDKEGKAVVGASVKPDGVGTGFSTSWGSNNGFPNEVVTGLNGEFIMAREQPFTRMSVNIKANGLAPAKVWLTVSNGVHQVRLGPGAVLTGRVLKGKQPLADIEVGVAGANRNSEVFAGHYETRTDAEGRFRFEHLPPNTDWVLYGLMKSLRREGSLPPRPAKSGGDDDAQDLGDLELQRGLTLAGEVKTVTGEPLPSNLRVSVSFDSAWDNQAARVDRTGKFELTGLPPGSLQVYLNTSGGGSFDWVPSGENRSLEEWSSRSLVGILNTDKVDMLILIRKQDRSNSQYYSNNGYLPDGDRPRNLPLAGAETTGPELIYLSGSIVDDVTGQPLRSVRVTPGRKPPTVASAMSGNLVGALVEAFRPRPAVIPWNERPYWERNRTIDVTGGHFSLPFRQLTSRPMLQVESEGYEVLQTEAYAASQTNLVLRMKKGSGPKGVVVDAEGRPVQGIAVIYGAEQEQFSLNSDATLSSYGDNRARVVTGADGAFAFPSKPNGRRVFAADERGWVSVAVKDWPVDGRIRFQPWAQVSGTLVGSDGKPASGTQLGIESQRNMDGDSWMNFQERPTADAQGRFAFKYAPPEAMRLVYIVPMQNGGWMHAPQTNFTTLPGKALDLGTMTKVPSRF